MDIYMHTEYLGFSRRLSPHHDALELQCFIDGNVRTEKLWWSATLSAPSDAAAWCQGITSAVVHAKCSVTDRQILHKPHVVTRADNIRVENTC